MGDGLSSSDFPKFEVTRVHLHGLTQVRDGVKKTHDFAFWRKRERLRLD